jgi:MFS transporter, putative metabolite:H+ symporter
MEFISVNEALDRIGFGRFHWFLVVISGLGFGTIFIYFLLAGATVELLMMSLIKTQIGTHYGIDPKDNLRKGLVTSVCFLGELLGGLVWSFVSDKISRRITYISTALFTALFALVGLIAPNYYIFLVSRLGMGFGLGGSMSIDFIYFLEFSPRSKSKVPRTAAIIYIGILALVYLALGGYAFLPNRWRLFMGFCAAPMVVLALIRLLIPWESPLFLFSRGKYEECKRVLKAISRLNKSEFGQKEEDYVLISESPSSPSSTDSAKRDQNIPWGITIGLASIFFCQALAYYGVSLWIDQFAVNNGISGYSLSTNLLVISCFEFCGVFFTQNLLKYFPIYISLVVNFIGAGICLALLKLFATGRISFSFISSSAYFFIVGVWGILYMSGPQLFGVSVRGRLFGLCTTMGKIGGMVGPALTGIAFQKSGTGSWLTISLIIACYVVASISAGLLIKIGKH